MVKVKEEDDDDEEKELSMAESKSASFSNNTAVHQNITNNSTNTRKARNSNHIHLHQTYHHYTYYHHHFSYPTTTENVENSREQSPAKFYFGPGFEPHTQQITNNNNNTNFSDNNCENNSSEYVVFFHVNPGVIISFQIGESLEILRGPVTVPMVSTNSSPPIAMPVQVPPGHVVQHIVDENGTLRHMILSSQHTAGLVPLSSHNPQHYGTGSANGTNPLPTFYPNVPSGFVPSSHYHSNVSHPVSPTSHSPTPPPSTGGSGSGLIHTLPTQSAQTIYYKDERTQKQHNKLRRKIYDKQKKGENILLNRNGIKKSNSNDDKGMDSVGTSEDGEECSIVDEDDSVQVITDILSSVQAPKVSELSSRSALLQWAPPTKLSNQVSSSSNDDDDNNDDDDDDDGDTNDNSSKSDNPLIDISENDLRYEVLLSDKSKEMKFKSIYSGASLSCRIQDLKPGQEYSVCLQAHLDELQGSATDPIKFITPPCEPDQPQPPKLYQRLKNSIQLRWNSVNDNGSHITNYILEYDEGRSNNNNFVEFHRGRVKQHTLHKLQPGTPYRFRLAALNEIGKSLYSEIVTYYTCNNAPPKPQPPKLTEASINYLHLKWERCGQDEEFTLQMNDPKTKYYLPVYNGRDIYYLCTGLLNFTEYKFRLRAENDGGQSPWSDEIVYKTLPDRPQRPSKPIVKGRIHSYSFKLKWEPPLDTGGAEITEYQLELNSGSGYRTIYMGIETEANCDKLTPGTTYQLRVCCKSLGGCSNYSDPCTVTTDAIHPGLCPIPKLNGKPKPNQISLKWQEPDYNGGAPILEYEVELIHNETSQIVYKNKQLECTVLNLEPGCLYLFGVRAINRIGPGLWSDYIQVTSGSAPPNTPQSPLIQFKSPFHLLCQWSEPQCNGAPIQEYNLEMTTENDDCLFRSIYQGPELFYDLKGLQPNTRYYFRLQAQNSAGTSPYSNKINVLTPAAHPATVTTIHNNVTAKTITLNWQEPANNGSEILHYNIEISDKLIKTTNSLPAYTFHDLESNQLYRIRLQAVNSIGIGNFSPIHKIQTLQPPPKPPKLHCINVGSNFLKLKWGDGNKNPDYIQYNLEMENVRSHEFHSIYKGTSLTYKVNRLNEQTTYTFRINASSDVGIGDYSNLYQFKTTIALPNTLKIPKMVDLEQRFSVIEWIPARNSFNDVVAYQVHVSKVNDQTFKQVHRIAETKLSIENLEPGMEYSVKVCPIRITNSKDELYGSYSPELHFMTLPLESINVTSISSISTNNTTDTNLLQTHHNRKMYQNHFYLCSKLNNLVRTKLLSDQPIFYAILITVSGIIIALLIMSFL